MKNLANYISISRIVMSILLIMFKPMTLPFNIIYLYCGISDMIDGFIARKSNNVSKTGALLDSIADIFFLVISLYKIIPLISLPTGIIAWIIIIALIKVYNVISAYISSKKIVLPHTIPNKITGLILFISPIILLENSCIPFEIVVCIIATFSAIQERLLDIE